MRLAEIIPSYNLRELNGRAILDEKIPALGEQPVVASINPILVVRVHSVVLKEMLDDNKLMMR